MDWLAIIDKNVSIKIKFPLYQVVLENNIRWRSKQEVHRGKILFKQYQVPNIEADFDNNS